MKHFTNHIAISCPLVNVESNGNVSIWIQGIKAVCKQRKRRPNYKQETILSPKKLNHRSRKGKSVMPANPLKATKTIDSSAEGHTREGIGAIFLWR